jgi:hypothetical protein
MELIYTGKFRRDYRRINSGELIEALNEKLKQIKNAPDTAHIPFLKKLKRYDRIYRLEIRLKRNRIYWIVCTVRGNKIYFRRIKSEVSMKRELKSYNPHN